MSHGILDDSSSDRRPPGDAAPLIQVSLEWPRQIPARFDSENMRFLCVKEARKAWPAMRLCKDDLRSMAVAMQHGDDLKRADHVFERAIQESLRQNDAMKELQQEMEPRMRELEGIVGEDRDSDNSSWNSNDNANREEMEKLEKQHTLLTFITIHMERDRTPITILRIGTRF